MDRRTLGRRISCNRPRYATTVTPLNRLWFKIGLLLHKIVSPLVMGLVFFSTVVPTGLLMRLFEKGLWL